MQRRLTATETPLRVWFHRFSAVSLIIISALFAALDFYRPEVGAVLRTRVADSMVPFMDGMRRPLDGVAWVGEAFRTNGQLRSRIEELEAERDGLRPDLNRLGALDAEVRDISTYLGFDVTAGSPAEACDSSVEGAVEDTSNAAVTARNLCVQAIGRRLSLLRSYMGFSAESLTSVSRAGRVVQVSAGSFGYNALIRLPDTRDVLEGQAAISLEGMVGVVAEVGENSVRLRLITDPSSSVAARVLRTRADVIVRGNGERGLTVANADADEINAMAPGDILLTSGAGGFFDENIPLGRVVSTEAGVVTIEPVVDLSQLSFVNIVLAEPPDLIETSSDAN